MPSVNQHDFYKYPHPWCEFTKKYGVSIWKPTPKSWVSETLTGFPKGSKGSNTLIFTGCPVRNLVKSFVSDIVFWVSWKPGYSVISPPAGWHLSPAFDRNAWDNYLVCNSIVRDGPFFCPDFSIVQRSYWFWPFHPSSNWLIWTRQ